MSHQMLTVMEVVLPEALIESIIELDRYWFVCASDTLPKSIAHLRIVTLIDVATPLLLAL